MKKLLLITTLILPLLLSSESWAVEIFGRTIDSSKLADRVTGIFDRTIDSSNLVKRSNIYYKKFTEVPFTGKTEGQIQASFKDGKPQGEWVEYDKNGQLEFKSNYVNGKLHGEKVYYSVNGQLKSKDNYKNGYKQNTVRFDYYKNGQLWNKANYVNGKQHGEEVWYFENGQVLSKANYVNGKLVD